MKFMKSVHAGAALSAFIAPKDLNTHNEGSIRNVASTLAHDTMVYYTGNTSAPGSVEMGNVPKPYYWWVAGALWGAMLDYYHYTKDPSYNDVVIQALLAPTNLAPTLDYMPKEHAQEEGNDDLFFWGSAVMAAAERNFPQPNEALPSWLDLAANVFNSLVSRWDESKCGGGMLWQIYPSNPNGMTYKNSISNGGLFQLAARLARATGNTTYLDWATRTWDWSFDKGLIDHDSYHVYDGVDTRQDCRQVNRQSFTYTSGVYLYGAAVLANHTGRPEWADRASRLLDGAAWFFRQPEASPRSPAEQQPAYGGPPAANIMWEASCEEQGKCNNDMVTFKGYLSRFMWQSAVMAPALRRRVDDLLLPTAAAAAATCTGGRDARQCGMRWYRAAHDGRPGLGSQMCALEAVQGLLAAAAEPPLRGPAIKLVRDAHWKAQAA